MAAIFGTFKKAWDNTGKKNYVQVISTVSFTKDSGYLSVGSSASVVGSAVPLTSSKTSVLRAYGDDNAAVLGATAVRASVSRFLCTVSQTGETSMFGSHGQFKVKAPIDCTLTSGNRAGSWNYCELAGTALKTITLSGANKFTGGAFGMAEWDGVGSLTISASHIFGAFGALTNVVKGAGTFTRTGIFAAYSTMNNATASYSAFDYGMYMAAGSVTQAIYANCDVMGAAGRVAQFYGTCAAPAMTDGYGAVEVDLTISGTAGDTFAANAFSSWVNIPTGTVGAGKYICAQNNGVYEASAATVTNAKIIFGMRAQKLIADTDSLSFPFSINTNNTAITAVFDVNNATDMGWVDGVLSSATGDGHIPLFRDAAGVVHYVNTYVA